MYGFIFIPFWNVLKMECAFFVLRDKNGMCIVWNVLKIECAFSNVPFWNVLFLECALFAQNRLSPFWNVIKMKCALFGMCSF